MELLMYQVDAFTDRVFGGNPAAVIPLEEWLPDATLQDIAVENNLSETAYYVQQNGHYHLRWFTPAHEIELCGHATLASAFVLYELQGFAGERIHFESMSGPLYVSREGEYLVMDFPAAAAEVTDQYPGLGAALGKEPALILETKTKIMAVFNDAKAIHEMKPNFFKLSSINKNVIVTARGEDCDFISRFFAPAAGINEDPVTGSAHTVLTPYWSEVLGKSSMTARQVSKRGGYLICENAGDRVKIKGQAKLYLSGRIEI